MRTTPIITFFIIGALGATNLGTTNTFSQERSPLVTASLVNAPLVTDRPDFTESPLSIVPGVIQIEAGASWSDAGSRDVFSGPELLARVGLTDRLEIRIGAPDYISADNHSGFGDMIVGAKVQLTPSSSVWNAAVIGQASLPTGNRYFTADRVEPEIILTGGTELSSGLSLGLQGGLKSYQENNDTRTEFTGTLVVSGAVGENLSAFGEGLLRSRNGNEFDHVIHVGLARLITSDFQIDFHAGTALDDFSDSVFMGMGAAVRL